MKHSTHVFKTSNEYLKSDCVNAPSCVDLGGCDCEGWLQFKRQDFVLRWCILRNSVLNLMVDKKIPKVEIKIQLLNSKVMQLNGDKRNRTHFQIQSEGTSYTFFTETKTDYLKWLNKLHLSIAGVDINEKDGPVAGFTPSSSVYSNIVCSSFSANEYNIGSSQEITNNHTMRSQSETQIQTRSNPEIKLTKERSQNNLDKKKLLNYKLRTGKNENDLNENNKPISAFSINSNSSEQSISIIESVPLQKVSENSHIKETVITEIKCHPVPPPRKNRVNKDLTKINNLRNNVISINHTPLLIQNSEIRETKSIKNENNDDEKDRLVSEPDPFNPAFYNDYIINPKTILSNDKVIISLDDMSETTVSERRLNAIKKINELERLLREKIRTVMKIEDVLKHSSIPYYIQDFWDECSDEILRI